MSADFIHVLAEARCSRCGSTVSAPIGELRSTGVFGCACGNVMRASYPPPEARQLFRSPNWR